MNTLLALVLGSAAGAHAATWGMYKDSPYEGFSACKYARSIALGACVAAIVQLLAGIDPTRASGLLVLFGLTYALERATTEFYKVFLREEDQSKYTIPMRLAVRGQPVQHRGWRRLAGLVYVVGTGGLLGAITLLPPPGSHPATVVTVLLVGSIGGWLSAVGGAWKDAPIEGFEWLKFFRSPLVAGAFAWLLAGFTDSYLELALAALGFTIATIETYKTFRFPDRPCGKFAGKAIRFPEMCARRREFVRVFVTIWIAVIAAGIVAFIQPHSGLV